MDWSKTSGGHQNGLELEHVTCERRLKELGLLTLGKILKLWVRPKQPNLTGIASSRALTRGLQRYLLMKMVLLFCD